MRIERHVNRIFNSMTYWTSSNNGAWMVDPGDCNEGFERVHHVLLTHGHFDHIYGLNELLRKNPTAVVYTNAVGQEMLLDTKLNMSKYNETLFELKYPDRVVIVLDGDTVNLGNDKTAKAIFTPGHSDSCITWVVDDMVFCGDSYIPGVKTVTNLPGGDKQLAQQSEDLIKEISKGKFLYPGHAL